MCSKKPAKPSPCPCPPPPVSYQSSISINLNIKPVYRSPIDNLGFPDRCCCCIPLRIGVAIICFISFMWALVELTRSEKTILAIFPGRGDCFKFFKMFHLTVITVYLFSCGVLLIGVISSKYKAINVYVWVALVFNCLSIVVIMVSLACQVTRTGMTRRIAMIMTLSVAWYSSFFYYISVVNSYKYRLLGSSLLQNSNVK
ncbi:hypothetical protein PYW08_009609 [Mythimna loreyi]|uniref:Uncharacterized protein n=1 Tax=Mythimna loreyi TaxID=667449 RepID=A0ACC2QBC1_9NEOP|nr:hypothetical protein PYW08_009609 [Mythimna loreyi]